MCRTANVASHAVISAASTPSDQEPTRSRRNPPRTGDTTPVRLCREAAIPSTTRSSHGFGTNPYARRLAASRAGPAMISVRSEKRDVSLPIATLCTSTDRSPTYAGTYPVDCEAKPRRFSAHSAKDAWKMPKASE
jgi:hypothetical protein